VCPGKWNGRARAGRESELFRSKHERYRIERSELDKSCLAVGVNPARIAEYGAKLGGFGAEQFGDKHGMSRWNDAEYQRAATTNVKTDCETMQCGLRPAFFLPRSLIMLARASLPWGKSTRRVSEQEQSKESKE
jgi:hypothetical protein